jgi:hypothetical protein
MEMISKFGCNIAEGPCPNGPQSLWTIVAAREHLESAHHFLARHGKTTLKEAAELDDAEGWGARVKRKGVSCPSNDLVLVHHDKTQHNLAEVVNMCATVERLIDALTWAESEFMGWVVAFCHPTQTSGTGENDLVLMNPENKKRARFEVSDVSGFTDGNAKIIQDLVSLGVLKERESNAPIVQCLEIEQWPEDRLFLVISEELAQKLDRRRVWLTGTPPHCFYERRQELRGTVIVEVKDGT